MTASADTFGRKYVRARKATQILTGVFWLSLPYLGLLQIDIAHLRLMIAGHQWPPLSAAMLPAEALKRGAAPQWDVIAPALAWTVLPVVFLAIAFILTARVYGRVHCGFTCFYGFMAETGEVFWRWARKPGPGRPARVALFVAAVLAAAPFMAFTILALVATPAGQWQGLAAGNLAYVVPFGVFTAVAVVMGAFVRLRFCRYVCGVGLIQSAAWMTNKKALEMGFHPKASEDGNRPLAGDYPHGSMRDCTGCHGCRDVCPIGFDPRAPKRGMMACFQCAACLVRCEEELYPLGKGPAIGFHLYDPGYPLAAQKGQAKAPSLVAMARKAASQPE
jgi:ferredoxin-type protein NapH